MIWAEGDIALIDAPGQPEDLKYCVVLGKYVDEVGGNDYWYDGHVIPNAYTVSILSPKRKDLMIAGSLLTDCDDPCLKVNWADCPWSPE